MRNQLATEEQAPFHPAAIETDDAILARLSGIDIVRASSLLARMAWEQVSQQPLLTSWDKVSAYLSLRLATLATEELHILFLDRKNRLIYDECMWKGTVDHCPIYPREVMKRALELDCSAIIVSHNHPSGDATPSKADIEMTKQLVNAALTLGIVVHDHIVVGKSGNKSFRSLGLM